jgi:hypothetical protein
MQKDFLVIRSKISSMAETFIFFITLMRQRTIEKSIIISAPVEKVWQILTTDGPIREWAKFFGPGTYPVAEWKQGGKISRFVDGTECVRGKLIIFQENVKMVNQFYDNLPEGLFSEELGMPYEGYQLHSDGENMTVLEIDTGPFSKEDRKLWGEDMSVKRDAALENIRQQAERK